MEYEERPMAFVAMKFEDDHWRDKKYIIIREELERCGYQVCRADEIKTSSAVVDEVCRLMTESELVIMDSSGDSHSVSYEIGYCHGINRDPNKTMLIRQDGNMPFNYRHFRHRVYKDMKHLRRLLRDYLDITEPLTDDQYGYAFTFEYSKDAMIGYILDGASCIFKALIKIKFTGRCECYSAEQFFIGDRFFIVGVGLRNAKGKKTPDYKKWMNIVNMVEKFQKDYNGRITLDTSLSELTELRALRQNFLACGVAEMKNGRITKTTSSEMDGADFFESYIDNENA